jgi:hypothetical protein
MLKALKFWLITFFSLGYLLPAAIATYREHKNATPIWIVNIFLGWTFIGWVIALVWSFTYQENY